MDSINKLCFLKFLNFSFFLVLVSLNLQAQNNYTIKGFVKTKADDPMPFVDLLIKKNDSTKQILAFASTKKNGFFEIKFNSSAGSVEIETSTYRYEPYRQLMDLSQDLSLISINIVLEPRIEELNEVQVKATPKVSIRNDTTSFDIDQFKEGNEVVVEDLLGKLPGISIEENGRIKFKGKDVTNVLLDGDNLFNGNYSIGTKNLNVSFLEGIEAIENFENNPLLQGLSENNEVALNLRLKRGLLISNTTEATLANRNRFALSSTSIVLSKKLKSFIVGSYNNIGDLLNLDSFDASTFIRNVRNQRDDNNSANSVLGNSKQIVPELNNSSNSEGFGSVNLLPVLSSNETLRINTNIYSDRLGAQSTVNTTYFTPIDTLNVTEERNRVISPRYLNSSVFYQKYLSKDKTISFNLRFTDFKINNNQTGILNEAINEESFLLEESFIGNSFSFVNRTGPNSALVFSTNIISSKRPERLVLFPGFSLDETLQLPNSKLEQNVISSRSLVEGKFRFFTRKQENKFSAGLRSTYTLDKLESDLTQEDLTQVSINKLSYQTYSTQAFVDYLLTLKKWSVQPKGTVDVFTNILEKSNNRNPKNTSILTNLGLLIKFRPNTQSVFGVSTFTRQTPPNDAFLFSESILTPNRIVLDNKVDLSSINTQGIDMNYQLNNLTKGANLSVGYSYQEADKGFIPVSRVFDNRTFITNELFDAEVSTSTYKLLANRYFPSLKSTITLTGSYIISNYFNALNNSDLRSNSSLATSIGFNVGTSKLGWFVFGNQLSYLNVKFDSNQQRILDNTAVTNNFTIRVLPSSRLSAAVNYNTAIPSLTEAESINHQMDASINLSNKKGTIQYRIEGRNLIDQNLLPGINNSDFSTTTTRENLFNRLLLISVKFRL